MDQISHGEFSLFSRLMWLPRLAEGQRVGGRGAVIGVLSGGRKVLRVTLRDITYTRPDVMRRGPFIQHLEAVCTGH